MNGIFKLLHHVYLSYKLRYLFWYFQTDLASDAKPEVLRPDLGFSMPFCVSACAFLQPRDIYLRAPSCFKCAGVFILEN